MDSRYVSYKKSHVTFFLLVSTSSLPLPFNKIFATLKWLCRDIGNSFHFYLYIYIYFFICSRVTHKISTRHNVGPRKYPQEKTLALQNTHEKKVLTHEIPTRKNFEPTKYPREPISDLRRHNGTIVWDPWDPRWHNTHGI